VKLGLPHAPAAEGLQKASSRRILLCECRRGDEDTEAEEYTGGEPGRAIILVVYPRPLGLRQLDSYPRRGVSRSTKVVR
jgi:hypothetical protein